MIDSFSDSVLFGVIIAVGLISATVNFIFFVKMWMMTNNVNEIKELLREWLDLEHPVIEEPRSNVTKK